MKLLLCLLLFGFFVCTSTPEKRVAGSNTAKGFTLIELFTSEGCSSCPPADRLLKELKEKYSDGNVLILAYHVDYWNHLGWEDRFSSADNTSRQNYYAGIFNLSSVYTPQVIINGETEFTGSDREKLEASIHSSSGNKKEFDLSASEAPGGKISVMVKNLQLDKDEILLTALVEKQATTRVKKGENEGRELSHINIVRAFSVSADTQKPVGFQRADKSKADYLIAAFIQDRSSGRVSGFESAEIN